ncbi:hypothetical protein [Paenarthrobacter sp. CAP02]|jgi:hypothetical protein|uniref:hypothetical protein n=1 Tax=Paenarthrobacter sp. CAP02 TaxID=3158144 RepID=UPI0032DBD903
MATSERTVTVPLIEPPVVPLTVSVLTAIGVKPTACAGTIPITNEASSVAIIAKTGMRRRRILKRDTDSPKFKSGSPSLPQRIWQC